MVMHPYFDLCTQVNDVQVVGQLRFAKATERFSLPFDPWLEGCQVITTEDHVKSWRYCRFSVARQDHVVDTEH